MQKKLIALAIAGLASGAAFAQNNVTIYGVADVGVEVGNYGDGAKFRVQSGQSAGSRLGFKGEEALGNGLSAIWTAEMGIAFDNGQLTSHTTNTGASSLTGSGNVLAANGGTNTQQISNSVFQRQIFAGLKSAQFGQVTFGRQYTPGFYVKAKADTFGLGMGGTANNAWANLGAFGADRLENEVQYLTPTFAGFTAGVGFSSGNEVYNNGAALGVANRDNRVTDNSKKDGRTWGALAMYSGYGLDVGFAYHDITGQVGAGTIGQAVNAQAAGGIDINYISPANDNARIKGWILGGNYDVMGYAKVFAGYASSKATRSGTNNLLDGNNLARGDVWNLGVKVPFGAHSVGAQYSRWNDKMTKNTDYSLWGVGYEYAMSKRTALYAGYAHASNKNQGTGTINTATNTGMVLTENTTSQTQAVTGINQFGGVSPWTVNVGMRHSF